MIIATDDRAGTLHACLEALCHQTLPATDFEVILVVAGSSNPARELPAPRRSPYRLRAVWEHDSGPAAARNRGVDAAAGPYCLFLDDDTMADPRLLAEHLRVQRAGRGVIGLGHLVLTLPRRAAGFARYRAQMWNDHYALLKEGVRAPSFMDCHGTNVSVPRAALLEVGGFASDLPFGYAVELGYRLARHRVSCVYIPGAIGHTAARTRFREITAEVEQAGAASVTLYRRHPPLLVSLEHGPVGGLSLRALLLRRVLLSVGAPLWPFALAELLRGRSGTQAWDRFVHSYCYWRGIRRTVPDRDTWQRLIHSPVILLYHAVGGPGEPAGCYVIPRRRFAQQMAWLKWRRYHVLSLEEFLGARHAHRLPPARAVILTFDDGYADNRAVAYPLLRRYGFPATIFAVSQAVGGTNQWDRGGELAGRPLLSWAQMREMLQGGVHFGAHTRRHAALTTVSTGQAEDEVAGPRVDLERGLGRPILAFAYPHGKYDAARQALVERAGFLGACCSESGVNEPAVPLYALRRLEIQGTYPFVRFALALWLASG